MPSIFYALSVPTKSVLSGYKAHERDVLSVFVPGARRAQSTMLSCIRCVRNHPSVNTSDPEEAKVSHSDRKTLNITLADVLVNKIQNYDLDVES